MNLHVAGFNPLLTWKKRTLKVVTLQDGADKKRKVKSVSSASYGNERYNSSTGHNSSTVDNSVSTMDENGVIIAVTEGRGEATCEIGIAAMSTMHPELAIFQISDTSSYFKILNKIYVLNPSEILVPTTMTDSRLVGALRTSFPNTKIIAVDRSAFRKETGAQYVSEICAPAFNSVQLILLRKYYALAATGALRLYLQAYKRSQYAKGTIKVTYSESDFNTMIDLFVAEKLELITCAIQNSTNPRRKYSSLRGILNHTITKLGARMLRATILQPPNQVEDIEDRLDCVEELYKCPEKLLGIRDALKKLSNLGQILSLSSVIKSNCVYNDEKHLNYILQLQNYFGVIDPIKELLSTSTLPFFRALCELISCTEFQYLNQCFGLVIHEDARLAFGQQGKVARCFAIRRGQMEVLDILRKKYSDIINEMREHVTTVSREVGYDLKLAENVKKGYHMVFTLGPKREFRRSTLSADFCQIDVTRTQVTMKTIKLLTLTNQLDDTSAQIMRVSNLVIHDLLLKVQENIGRFYDLCDFIAKLDVLQSLAQAIGTASGYVRPKFDDYTHVVNGRHPLLDFILDTTPVANDIICTPDNRLHLITGPNGSGKSIYIRQIVLLQIMAQIGCFVPAQCATFKICDRILARIFFEDNMECGVSTFALEMKEIKYFFNVITDRTLIIIDELCRSTAVREGTALAMAICEHFMKTPAFVYFTTHYTYITRLQQLYPNIKCWQLETHECLSDDPDSKPTLQYTHRVIPGVVTLNAYGLAMARAVWSDAITDDVQQVLEVMNDKHMNTSVDKRIAVKINLENELWEIKRRGNLTARVLYKKWMQYEKDLAALGVDIDYKEYKNHRKRAQSAQQSAESETVVGTETQEHGLVIPEAVYGSSTSSSEKVMNQSDMTETSFLQQQKKKLPKDYEEDNEEDIANSTLLDEDVEDFPRYSPPRIPSEKRLLSPPPDEQNLQFAAPAKRPCRRLLSNESASTSMPILFADELISTSIPNLDFTFDYPKQNDIRSSTQPVTKRPLSNRNIMRDRNDTSLSIEPVIKRPCLNLDNRQESGRIPKGGQSFEHFNYQIQMVQHGGLQALPTEADLDQGFIEDDVGNDYGEHDQCFIEADENDLDIALPRVDFFCEAKQTDNEIEICQPNPADETLVNIFENQGDKTIVQHETEGNIFNFPPNSPNASALNIFENEGDKMPVNTDGPLFNFSFNPLNDEPAANSFEEQCDNTIICADEATNSFPETSINSSKFFNGVFHTSSQRDYQPSNNFPDYLGMQAAAEYLDGANCLDFTFNGKHHDVIDLGSSSSPTSKPTAIESPTVTSRNIQKSLLYHSSTDKPSTSASTEHTEAAMDCLPAMLERSHIGPSGSKKRNQPVQKTLNQLTRREIEGYFRQREDEMLSRPDQNAEAYCQEVLNRPSVRQIQASEVVLTARRASSGQYVVDVPKQRMVGGRVTKKLKRFQTPWKVDGLRKTMRFDATMFSDANSSVFANFIKTHGSVPPAPPSKSSDNQTSFSKSPRSSV